MADNNCEACNRDFDTPQGLGQHVRSAHGGIENYYYEYEQSNCENCGDPLKFSRTKWRTKRFCDEKCAADAGAIGFDSGVDHPNWSGGTYDWYGYTMLSDRVLTDEEKELAYPMRRKAGNDSSWRVLEHRLVMAKSVGRPLEGFETVHHKNGVRNDNRPENLELWIGKHAAGLKAEDVECPCCGYIFNRYTENGRES